jgi:hypothetical protein
LRRTCEFYSFDGFPAPHKTDENFLVDTRYCTDKPGVFLGAVSLIEIHFNKAGIESEAVWTLPCCRGLADVTYLEQPQANAS